MMKTAEMISVREFTFRTEKPSFPVRLSPSSTPVKARRLLLGQLCKDSPRCPSWGDDRHCKQRVTNRRRELSCRFRWLLQFRLAWGVLPGSALHSSRLACSRAGKHTERCHRSLSCNSRDFRLGLKHISVAIHGACPQPTPHAHHLSCIRWERQELPWTLAVSS